MDDSSIGKLEFFVTSWKLCCGSHFGLPFASIRSELNPKSSFETLDLSSHRQVRVLLWGAGCKIKLVMRFKVKTAMGWASRSLNYATPKIDERIALDYMCELSNLHAAYLRGIFERTGMVFGVSLPLVLATACGLPKVSGDESDSILLRWLVKVGDDEIILDMDFDPGPSSKIYNHLLSLNSMVEVDILRETAEKKAS